MIDVAPIDADGFQLRSFPTEALEALLSRDLLAVQELMHVVIESPDADWVANSEFGFGRRLALMRQDPSARPWLDRAIVRADQVFVGHICFHDPPNGSSSLELGYGILPAYRRRGYATAAVRAMMDWAASQYGIERFILSIGVENAPSLALASKLGFVRIGEQMDERDGLEAVFELLRAQPTSSASR